MKIQKQKSRLLASFLAISVFLLCVIIPEQSIFAETDQPVEIWSGNIATEIKEGSGTASNPYIIKTGEELAYAVANSGLKGSSFKLGNDIYLNDVSEEEWYLNSDNHPWINFKDWGFRGNLDGDGHCIYGLWYPEDTTVISAGIIPSFSSGTIQNIGVRYSQIFAVDYAGGIVGKTTTDTPMTIDSCFVDETVRIKFTSTVDYGGAGGIIGYASLMPAGKAVGLTISNCYSKARLYGWDLGRSNGIIGTSWNNRWMMKNCYCLGYSPYCGENSNTFSALYDSAGISPENLCQNVYTDTQTPVGLENFKYVSDTELLRGETAKTVMPGLDYETVFETVENGTPKLRCFTQLSGEDVDITKDGKIFSGGYGRRGNPYQITTAEQLRYLIENTETAGKYYRLENDIEVNDTSDPEWMTKNPIEWFDRENMDIAFAGVFDGNGHTVRGLYVQHEPAAYDAEDSNSVQPGGAALFPVIKTTAQIRNVHVRDSYISGRYFAGAIAGFQSDGASQPGHAQIVGCSADASVTVKGQTAGGLLGGGARGIALYYSYFTGKLEGAVPDRTNALIGDMWSSDNIAAECYSIGYTNYRLDWIPSTYCAIYGTEKQNGTVVVSADSMIGEKAKTAFPDFNWDSYWDTVKGGTPHPRVIPMDMTYNFNDEGVVGRVWSGKIATKYAGGTGDKNDPYIIETPEQLAYLVKTCGQPGKYFKMVADMELNDTSAPDWESTARSWFSDSIWWYSVGLRGHFDGGGHVVSGLYYKGDAQCVALFPSLCANSSIENVGVINSTLITTGNYAAAITAWWHQWMDDDGVQIGNYTMPEIHRCFADDTVYIEAGFSAGGIAGASSSPILIEDCYFTGKLNCDNMCGGLWADCWTAGVSVVHNCYVYTADGDAALMNGGGLKADTQNVYVDGERGYAKDATLVNAMGMFGESAKTFMPGLDYDNVWQTVDGGTPVLRIFGSDRYSSRRRPTPVEISFASGGGSVCDPIYGYPYFTKITDLPKPTRYGYRFDGWYLFSDLDYPFNLETFPIYNITLFPKWTEIGVSINFESNPNTDYDLNGSAESYRPGTLGYDSKYVHGGMRSMHCLGNTEYQPMFLVSYEYTLEPGKQYDLNFWMTAETENASGKIELVHSNYADVHDETVGSETALQFTGLKAGEWKQYKITFTAGAPYLMIRTPQNVGLFFDDFLLVPLEKDGTYSGKPEKQNTAIGNFDHDDFDWEYVFHTNPGSSFPDTNIDGNFDNPGNSSTNNGKKAAVRKKIVAPVSVSGGNFIYLIVACIISSELLLASSVMILVRFLRKKKERV